LERNETLAGLTDQDLFQRLFQQRHEHDWRLLSAGQACAIVYSFQGEELSGPDAELPQLAALIGISPHQLFESVAELRRRDLVQQRGVWRAVLPHAIANRLAAVALENIPFAIIKRELINGAPRRLLKSFVRRLGYLHDSERAVAIAKQWLAQAGLLGDFLSLDELGRAMFNDIAPVIPGDTLVALERALEPLDKIEDIPDVGRLVDLLRSLAYDRELFERSAMLLAKLVALGDEKDAADSLKSLFFLYLSGTHASIEQRTQMAECLLRSGDPKLQNIGLSALSAMLEAWQFVSGYPFQFGARPRDHGYWPRTADDVQCWFETALDVAERCMSSDPALAQGIRRVLAKRFRGVWTRAGTYDALERVSRAIVENGHWGEGWLEVCDTLRFDHKELSPEVRARLLALEQLLRPKDLVQKVRAVLLGEHVSIVDPDDFDYEAEPDAVAAYERTDEIAQALGKAVATDEEALDELIPELLNGRGRLWLIGRGLAVGASDPEALWKRLVGQFAATPERNRNVQVLRGFLESLQTLNPSLVESLLDETVEDEVLAPQLPALQTAVAVNEAGVKRLMRALATGKTPANEFGCLAFGRSSDPIPGSQMRALVASVAAKPGGFHVALEVLHMRLYSEEAQHRPPDLDLAQAGRDLLERFSFDHNRERDNGHRLKLVMQNALTGSEGAETARLICQRFKIAVSKGETYAFHHGGLVRGLFSVQPFIVLNALLDGDEADARAGIKIINAIAGIHENPLDVVPDDQLLAWCNGQPLTRYPIAASLVTVVREGGEGAVVRWTPIAQGLLEAAPDKAAVLDQLIRRFIPRSWSGSHATIMAARAELLTGLKDHPDRGLSEHAMRAHARLQRQVEDERRSETERYKATDERFE
jgi:hypothetical protein